MVDNEEPDRGRKSKPDHSLIYLPLRLSKEHARLVRIDGDALPSNAFRII